MTMTDNTSTAPVMSLQQVRDALREAHNSPGLEDVLDSCATAIDAHLNGPETLWTEGTIVSGRANSFPGMNITVAADVSFVYGTKVWISTTPSVAPTPDVVGGDVVAKARDLIKRLRDTPNWIKEPWGDFKSAGANTFDRAPKEAAELLEVLVAAPSVQGDDLVRYCPECSLMGDVPVGARDCCPDGSAARLIPRHIAHAAHRDFHHSIKAHPAEQTRGDAHQDAWNAIVRALNESCPGWITEDDDPLQSAIAAIRNFGGAREVEQSRGDGVVADIIGDVCDMEPFDPDHEQAVCVNVFDLIRVIERHLPAPRQAVPDGWALSPRKATEQMLDACRSVQGATLITREFRAALFEAMIASAPSAGRMGVDRD